MMTRSNFPKQVTPAMTRTRNPNKKVGSVNGAFKAPKQDKSAPARKARKGC